MLKDGPMNNYERMAMGSAVRISWRGRVANQLSRVLLLILHEGWGMCPSGWWRERVVNQILLGDWASRVDDINLWEQPHAQEEIPVAVTGI
ncbi:hypothetical protein CDL15_Pgr023842 [Punica granatum]|uniref:Uncharacterized protein n=1 Tax=Punica granatum TaxID=22663 RepID=A0A218W0C5_PUNGR|nr:hypothetical protein CDL15_Pgr023842 [Punica granatum]